MNRQQVISDYEKMRNDIAKAKDEYLEQVYKYVKTYFNRPKEEWSWDTFSPSLMNIVYDSLANTYSITAKAVEKIYGITVTDKIDEDTLEKLTYSVDGKSLLERLEIHFNKAIQRNNTKDYLYNRIVLVIDTETLYASNHIIHGKLKRRAKFVEVLGSPDCSDEESGECEHYVSKGKMPIEELDELPPYHPDCECEVIYYFDEE